MARAPVASDLRVQNFWPFLGERLQPSSPTRQEMRRNAIAALTISPLCVATFASSLAAQTIEVTATNYSRSDVMSLESRDETLAG